MNSGKISSKIQVKYIFWEETNLRKPIAEDPQKKVLLWIMTLYGYVKKRMNDNRTNMRINLNEY